VNQQTETDVTRLTTPIAAMKHLLKFCICILLVAESTRPLHSICRVTGPLSAPGFTFALDGLINGAASAVVGAISQNDLRVHFGLGMASVMDSIEIVWPSGATTQLTNMQANRIVRIVEAEQ